MKYTFDERGVGLAEPMCKITEITITRPAGIMTDELKPCPFCGKAPKLDAPEMRSGTAWAYIRCDSYCGVKPMASGSADTDYYDKPFGEKGKYVEYRTEQEAKDFALNLAKDRWNTRAQPSDGALTNEGAEPEQDPSTAQPGDPESENP